ncbi:unnamed protein product [Cuscuta campestris]|uniref:Tubby C-terminal domain-containing protein n=2 Tax=Cuscuta sect. Cleistogrammica TaxID=1824901 RepID=A0A484MR01_9ASTE|nr:hypothetical protein DM860_013627 [Cuscuta australis]VFQ90616.1 unnamed protein product [Cuscuta campestris]
MFRPEITTDVPLIAVVGEAFCFPYLVDLTAKKGIYGVSSLQFDVSDGNGSPLLRVHGRLWRLLQKKRTISDPFGLPVVTMRAKTLALRNVWQVYKGESSAEENLLYTVRETKYIRMKVRLDVFMASNQGDICNFHVKGSYASQNFKVYQGDNVIAEVKEEKKIGNFFKGIERFDVRVFPGVDYAFVVSLLVIINAIDGGS